MSTKRLLEELMSCEHMGDVTKIIRRIALSVGVSLEGCHDDWQPGDWDAVDALKTDD